MVYNNPFKNSFYDPWYRIDLHIVYFFRCISQMAHRARYGWAACDVWNMDSYLLEILPSMLEYLAENHTGFPSSAMDAEDITLKESHIEYPLDEQADNEWKNILLKMATCFTNAQSFTDTPFTEESTVLLENFITSSLDNSSNWDKNKIKELQDKLTELALKEQEYQTKNLHEGCRMLEKYFHCLWD